ncbi:MAG: SUMF1/EgtB/PvdO family nonheme iron enzyme [Planctomycetota bacterium]
MGRAARPRSAVPAPGRHRPEPGAAFAAWNGMRLPTVGEWLWFASRPRAMTYPFGTNPAQSAANTLELGLWRATPVGTFPGGRTPGTAIYDLLGNVAEWALAEGWQGRGWYPRLAPELTFQGLESWAMGGSFRPTRGRSTSSSRTTTTWPCTPSSGIPPSARATSECVAWPMHGSGSWPTPKI